MQRLSCLEQYPLFSAEIANLSKVIKVLFVSMRIELSCIILLVIMYQVSGGLPSFSLILQLSLLKLFPEYLLVVSEGRLPN